MVKNFFHDINNKHKIKREEENKVIEDIHNNNNNHQVQVMKKRK